MATTKELEQRKQPTILPLCSIRDENHKVILVLELPGVEKGDVSISVEEDELKVRGRRSAPGAQGKYILRERQLGDYFASYTLDDTIDRDRIEAESAQGVLTLTLHLKESSKPKQIAVKEVR